VARKKINTADAPQAIGTYSQAVKVDNTVYLAGQIPLIPETMTLEQGDMRTQIRRVFDNLNAVAKASGGNLQDVVKLNVYLTDLSQFQLVNEVMSRYFAEPYPARAVVGVAALPKGAEIEMDAVMVLMPSKIVRLSKPMTSRARQKKNRGRKHASTRARVA
jgi:reactive intermediate/imine deaminase